MKLGYLVSIMFFLIFLPVALVLAGAIDEWKECDASELGNCYTVDGENFKCCLDGGYYWYQVSSCPGTCPTTTTTTTTTTTSTSTTTTIPLIECVESGSCTTEGEYCCAGGKLYVCK